MRSGWLMLLLAAAVMCMIVVPAQACTNPPPPPEEPSGPVCSGTVIFENTDVPPLFVAIVDYAVYGPSDPDNPVDAGMYPGVATEYTYVYTLRDSTVSLVPLDGLDIQLVEGVTISATGSIDDGDPATPAPDGPPIIDGTVSWDFFGGGTFPLTPGKTSEQFFMITPSAPGEAVMAVLFDGITEDEVSACGGPIGTGLICGHVESICCGDESPAVGVTIDLFSDGSLIATTATSETGDYCFDGLAAGTYLVTLVTPLGFDTEEEEKEATVVAGETTTVDFTITCAEVDHSCFARRTRCYWQHQVKSHLRRRHCWARVRCDDLSTYMNDIRIHFNENVLNPIVIFKVDDGADSLAALKKLLTVSWRETMEDKARAQLLALLLNVASNKLSQTKVISADGATVSQALTFVDNVIDDRDPSNDALGMMIAQWVNFGRRVPAGWIPPDTPDILYQLGDAQPVTVDFNQEPDTRRGLIDKLSACPNPVVTSADISFVLNGEGNVPVSIRVFDAAGRLIKTVMQRDLGPGVHSEVWDGRNEHGSTVSTGVYFYRVETPGEVKFGKLMVAR